MSIIEELVREKLTQDIPRPVPRDEIIGDLPAPARFNRVHIVTGMRRSGKTFYLYQRMHALIARGMPRDRMLYFDFSDDRLPKGDHVIDDVLGAYWRQVPEARLAGCYLFLDEVQDCDGWQGAARRIAQNEAVTMVLTGSSSKVSSSEIATQFRGRSHTHEMLPCSFAEFLRFHESELPGGNADALRGQSVYSPQEITALESLYDRYLVVGGFPDVQNDPAPVRREVLQGYVRDVVARDVAEKLARPSIPLATQLALLILRNTSNETSVNSLVSTLRGAGFRIGWERAEELVSLFRQAYLFFEVHEYARGITSGTTNPPKSYAIDPGLAYAVSRAAQEDIGNRLETAVYLELRRRLAGSRTDAICSYTEPKSRSRKVDFLVGEAFAGEAEPAAPYELVQVAASLESDRTRKREIESLQAAMLQTGLDRGIIVNLRESSQLQLEAGAIRIVPAWRWALETTTTRGENL